MSFRTSQVNISEIGVSWASIGFKSESNTTGFWCKAVIVPLPGEVSEYWVNTPTWIRERGVNVMDTDPIYSFSRVPYITVFADQISDPSSSAEGSSLLNTTSAASEISSETSTSTETEREVAYYQGTVFLSDLEADRDYNFYCSAEKNDVQRWDLFGRTKLAPVVTTVPTESRILNGDKASLYHNGFNVRVTTEGATDVQCRLIGPSRTLLGFTPSHYDPIELPISSDSSGASNNILSNYLSLPQNRFKGPNCFSSYPADALNDPTLYSNSTLLFPTTGPENGTVRGCGYSDVVFCEKKWCDAGIDGLLPGTSYDFECWSLKVPDVRTGGSVTTSVPSISCGPYSCAAIRSSDGKMAEFNQSATWIHPSDLPMRSLSTNGRTTCGVVAADVRTNIIITSHVVTCFGEQAEEFATNEPMYVVSVGEFHICSIYRGLLATMTCKGDDRWGQRFRAGSEQEAMTDFRSVRCGWTHCCAITNLKLLKCWGYLPDDLAMPEANVEFSLVASGRGYSCGILEADKRMQCWGTNEFGQGVAPREARAAEGASSNVTFIAKRWRTVGCGVRHTCGIDEARRLHCWGQNVMNQLLFSDEIRHERFVTVAVGSYHACAMTLNGRVLCFGPSLETSFPILNYTHRATFPELYGRWDDKNRSDALSIEYLTAQRLNAETNADGSDDTFNPDAPVQAIGLALPLSDKLTKAEIMAAYTGSGMNDTPLEGVFQPWNFFVPLEGGVLDYKEMNFLPQTSKFGFVSAGSGASGIPNDFV